MTHEAMTGDEQRGDSEERSSRQKRKKKKKKKKKRRDWQEREREREHLFKGETEHLGLRQLIHGIGGGPR